MRNSELQRQKVKMLNYKHGFSHKEKLYNVWKNIKDRCNRKNCKSYKNYGGRGIKVCDEWQNDYMSFRNWSIENGYVEEALENGINKLTIDRINNNGDYEPSNCRWTTNSVQSTNKQNSIKEEDRYQKCLICGNIIRIKRRNENRKTCSYKCSSMLRSIRCEDWANKNLKKQCPICSKEFVVRDGHFNRRIYCSRECKDMSSSPIWEFNGRKLRVLEWAKELGMTSHCLNHRKDMGWSIEEILTTPKGKKRNSNNE